jgi:prepilin-type N-terminal cleavage/methylation domain-containing protein
MGRARTATKTGHRRRNAFTLVELLTVIAIIGILASMVMAGLAALKKTARKKQSEATIAALKTAIRGYHAEYGQWPGTNPAVGGTWSTNNYVVIDDYLLSTGTKNPRGRTFWETKGTVTNPYTRTPFTISINTTNNSVTVN